MSVQVIENLKEAGYHSMPSYAHFLDAVAVPRPEPSLIPEIEVGHLAALSVACAHTRNVPHVVAYVLHRIFP